MDVRHLELLRELADRGTVTAVAEATFRSPSAVSQQLRSAERAFGIALVEPDGRGLRLTAAGRLLAEGAVGVATELGPAAGLDDDLRGRPPAWCGSPGCLSGVEFLVPLVSRLAGIDVELELADEDVAEGRLRLPRVRPRPR